MSDSRWSPSTNQVSSAFDHRRPKRPRVHHDINIDHCESFSPKPTWSGPMDVSSVSEKTKTLIRSWIDQRDLRTGMADLAKCAELDFDLCNALVYQELHDGSRSTPLPTPKSSPLRDLTNPIHPSASVALKEYLNETAQTQCSKLQHRKRKDVGPYQCTTKSCNYRTDTKESWHRHMDIRQPRNIFVCDECLTNGSTRPFAEHRKDKFREHLKDAHSKSWSKKADVKKDIEKKSQHHQVPQDPLLCGFCDEQFDTHETFREHVLRHFQDGKGDGKQWDVKEDWEERGPIGRAQSKAHGPIQAVRPP